MKKGLHYDEFDPHHEAMPEAQARAKQVLRDWRCTCVYGCHCYAYQQLLKACALGQLLNQRQHEIIALLLERGAK